MTSTWAKVPLILIVLSPAAFAQDAPGAINPDVTQNSIHQTICVNGWAKTVRPPAIVTKFIKSNMMAQARIPEYFINLYELDHVIPLELGGAPLDPDNLQLQLWQGSCNAKQKDQLEHVLSRKVCAGELTLAEAQRRIASDWTDAYGDFVNSDGCERD